jgi:predicted Zn-dependent protease
MTLCCNFYIFSQEEEVKISELKEVGKDTIIEILLVEENYPEIKELLKNYKEDSFFYNYTMGRVAYKENNKKDALSYFAKAQNYDNGNIDLRINLLKIYLTDRAYEKEVKEKFEYFDKAKLSSEQKSKVDKLKEVYEESKKINVKNG